MHIRSAVLALTVAITAQAVQLDKLVEAVRGEVRPQEAMEYMRAVYATDRWFTFSKFQETAETVKRAMIAIGLEDVTVEAVPADGVTQFGYWTEPLAWDAKSARLELLDTDAPEDLRVLADYEKVPASLGMWSGPTPPEGITAELVEYTPAANLRGKLVLTDVNPVGLKAELVRKGALGAVNAFTENAGLANGRQWINAWGDNGWGFTKTSTPLLSYSITPRQAAYVRKLLAEHRTVRVRATADTRYYPGVYPYVTGIIRGDGPGEEVLTLGHAFEQGAEDNATGVAAQLESLAALQRLIAAGKLPRPKRSIRVLIMSEMYGSMPYVAKNAERVRKTVAGICMDTPAGLYDLPGTEYSFYMNPHVAKSYVDGFILRLAAEYFPKVNRPWHEKPFRTGTDTYISEPMVGIPTAWPYSGSGVETHHNSEDTPDRVDPRSLRDLTVVNAAFLYYIAAAGEAEALWLAEVEQKRGLEQIEKERKTLLEGFAKTTDRGDRARLLYVDLERMQYTVDREAAAVLSVDRLLSGQRPARVVELADALRAAGKQAADRLGETAAVKPKRPEAELWNDAAKIVVKRKRFGTLPLDEIAPQDREGYPSGAWSASVILTLYWCDGNRTLAEAIRLMRMELGPVQFDFVGYFRFLRKHGYVEF